jgi:hypothetical protein
MKFPRTLLLTSVVFLSFAAVINNAWPEEYLSNLGDLWPDPTGVSMGDFETLVYPYTPFVVQFFTGSGTNEAKQVVGGTNSPTVQAFELTSVTFEFWGAVPQPWGGLTVEVSQVLSSNQSIVLGDLGNQSVNPTPTQWPGYTTFFDFHPLTNIVLQPSTEYAVSLNVPYGSPPELALLFTYSPVFFTPTDWQMGATLTGVPLNSTEYLKIAIGADAILSTNLTSQPISPVANVRLSASRVGHNFVLSWPATAVPSQLYMLPNGAPIVWIPILKDPITTNGNFEVTLPLSGSACYFRLQGQ